MIFPTLNRKFDKANNNLILCFGDLRTKGPFEIEILEPNRKHKILYFGLKVFVQMYEFALFC